MARVANPLRVRGKILENGSIITIRGCRDTGTGLSGSIMTRLRRERNSGIGLLSSGKLENDELCALLIGFDLSLASAIYTCVLSNTSK